VSAKGNKNSDRVHCVDSVNYVAILVALSNLDFFDFNQLEFSRGKKVQKGRRGLVVRVKQLE